MRSVYDPSKVILNIMKQFAAIKLTFANTLPVHYAMQRIEQENGCEAGVCQRPSLLMVSSYEKIGQMIDQKIVC